MKSISAGSIAPSFTIAVLALACLCTPAAGDTADAAPDDADAPASPPRDVLRHAIDPFNAVAQRQRFFAATGPDRELTREQFEADRTREDGFVQPFDSWPRMLAFDRNGNGTIDWFEAQAYRHDLRRRILARFDTSGTGRLTGADRDRANAVLSQGPLPEDRPGRDGRLPDARRTADRGQADEAPAEGDHAPFGPGAMDRMTDEQRRELLERMQRQQQQRMRELYDTDEEGNLTEEGREDLRQDMRRQGRIWGDMRQQWILQHFDASGTGELDEDERAELRQFERGLREAFGDFERRLLDFDGTGEVSEANRRAARVRYAPTFFDLAARWQQWADIDGDGQVSRDEAAAFNAFAAEAVADYFDRITRMHDADGDGVLDAQERRDLLRWVRRDLEARFDAADRSETGDLSPSEMRNFMLTWLRDIGIAPHEDEDDEAGWDDDWP